MKSSIIISGRYVDSTLLMKISRQIKDLDFVNQAVAVMGTEMNKTVISEFGGMTDEVSAAGPNDLIVSVDVDDLSRIEEVRIRTKDLVEGKNDDQQHGVKSREYPSIETAISDIGCANLAIISLPGEFAAVEALKAIEHGLHVFMFSDNVPLEDEIEIKKAAREKNLLVMGPGAGTAVIDGISIGLMSKIRNGNVGIVAASGSGLQEVAILLHKYGLGISQAIGTGGRDLSKEIGGSTMMQGISLLENDPDTAVIALVSKPPHPETARKIYDRVSQSNKPFVIFFLGGNEEEIKASGAYYAASLEDAAVIAAALSRGEKVADCDVLCRTKEAFRETVKTEKAKMAPTQKYLRGTFCGGTHSEEAVILLQNIVLGLHSNIKFGNTEFLSNRHISVENSLVDMGDEEFTRGRLHPVMDATILCERLEQEGSDPETAVILFDIILGYAADCDPVGAIYDSLKKIREESARAGRYVSMVASLTGTDLDPQGYYAQKEKLESLGVIVEESSSRAALLAGLIAAQGVTE